MTPIQCMQPRNLSDASDAVFGLTVAAAGVSALITLLTPQRSGGLIGSLVVVGVLIGLSTGAWLLRRRNRQSPAGWAIFPFVAIAAVVALDLLTRDASFGAQIFLTFPVLYAASQVPRRGAVAVLGASVLAECAIVFSQLAVHEAVNDAAYLLAALVASTSLLVLSGERRDALVAELERRAAVDPLTGLVTRRVLDNAAKSALSGAASAAGTALILLDLDKFKSVNDHHGHPAGDEVLVQLAELLRVGCRADDVVSRMGGDEIAILLPGCSLGAAQRRAEEICLRIRAHAFVVGGEQRLSMTASAGIAHAPTSAEDLHTIYAAADHALYLSKRGGRDQVSTALPRLQVASG
jgi:diguanylate cyclase (GGDEF)-like protein